MKSNFLIYNNSLINKAQLLDCILITSFESPSFEVKENLDFYYIDIKNFYEDKHILEISYKNDFLIFNILNTSNDSLLLKRIFYLKNIDYNNILLCDNKNSINFIIPKITIN